MAWTLLDLIEQVNQVDPIKLGLPAVKAGAAALGGYLLKKVMGRFQMEKCTIQECTRVGGRGLRGMCMTCYSKAKAKVEAGEVTWKKLAEKGLCKSESDPFDSAYERAMEDE